MKKVLPIITILIFNIALAEVIPINETISTINNTYFTLKGQEMPQEYMNTINNNMKEYKNILEGLGEINISIELTDDHQSIYNMTINVMNGNITHVYFFLPEQYGSGSNLYFKLNLRKVLPVAEKWITYFSEERNIIEMFVFFLSSSKDILSLLASGDIVIKPVGLLIAKFAQMPNLLTMILDLPNKMPTQNFLV